jgi:hypothetical protein
MVALFWIFDEAAAVEGKPLRTAAFQRKSKKALHKIQK